jgi:FkbM family methyltransferase
MSIRGLIKPEYLLKPGNILARLKYGRGGTLPAVMQVPLMGRAFRIRPHEVIGQQILRFGLFDLVVSECLLRLAAPGDRAYDVGANIGYTALVLARAVGPGGSVVAFEPHPEIFADLEANVGGTVVEAVPAAVSAAPGAATLHIPVEFGFNRGVATIEPTASETAAIEVRTVTLDEQVGPDESIGVLKIDVEGHELAVLQGASQLLAERRIRHIVFEDHQPADSAVIAHLQDAGYAVWRIAKRFWGPVMVPTDRVIAHSNWESPCFLATSAADLARERLAPRGWRALAG